MDTLKKALALILALAVSAVLAWVLLAGKEALANPNALRTVLALALALGIGGVLGWALWAGRTAIALVLTLGVVGAIGWAVLAGEASDSFDFDNGLAPAEYLYLDNGRVLSYLSQLKAGLSENEKRSIKVTESLDAGIEESPGKVGASKTTERFVEEVVTPTAASNFFRLFDELQGEGGRKSYLRTLTTREFGRKDDSRIEEGDFVALEGATVSLPTYAADYFFVKRFGSVYPGKSSGERLDCLILRKAERGRVRKWLRPFGRNPRIVLTARADKLRGVRIILPVEYASLADEQSLLAGAHLTIVGKVIRRIEANGDDYADTPTRTTFGPRLRTIPRLLLDKKDCASRRTDRRAKRGAPRTLVISRRREVTRGPKARLRRLRKQLFQSLKKETRVQSEGLVVLPVAIYSTGRADGSGE